MANCLIIVCYVSYLLHSFVLSQTPDFNGNHEKPQNQSIKYDNSQMRRSKTVECEDSLATPSFDTVDDIMYDDDLPLAGFRFTPSSRSQYGRITTRHPRRSRKLTQFRPISNTSRNAVINHRHIQNTTISSRRTMKWKNRRIPLDLEKTTVKHELFKSVITTPKINTKSKARPRVFVPANATARQQHIHVKNSSLDNNTYRRNFPESKIFGTSANKTSAVSTILPRHSDDIVQRVKHNKERNSTRQKNNRRTNTTQRKVIPSLVTRKSGNNTNTVNRRKNKLLKPKSSKKFVFVVAHNGKAGYVDILVSDYYQITTTEKYRISNRTKATSKQVTFKIVTRKSKKSIKRARTSAVATNRKHGLNVDNTRKVNNRHVFHKKTRSKALNQQTDIFAISNNFGENDSTPVTVNYSSKIPPKKHLSEITIRPNSRRKIIIRTFTPEIKGIKHIERRKSNDETTKTSPTVLTTTILENDSPTTKSETTTSDIVSTIASTTSTFTKTTTTTLEPLTILPVIKAPAKPLTVKEKERQKEYEHETLFARILRFLNKKNSFKHYGFTASVRVDREAVANGCIINGESVLTVLSNYHIAIEKNLSVRVGQGSESQIQEVISVIPYQVDTDIDNPSIIVILKVQYLFEFGKTVYEAEISSEKPKKQSIVATEWKYTNSPSEHLDIPLKLVNYNVGLARHSQCSERFGDKHDKTKSFCILRPVKKNGDYCKDLLGSLLVKRNTIKVMGILVTKDCNQTASFAKLSKIKEWIIYNTMLHYSDNIEESQVLT
ncbi:hypothetical protein ILUMI_22695 [Ignelater luminosus]|uniref:Peptidase S1 domain-containing protein n=1 Tax=Ignelater luminosus TaxID=2038154 RepID=A0A8K0CA60_IGNLU|nr:hypothetical protein ILUMI_22695 [Ignelater luminosus]